MATATKSQQAVFEQIKSDPALFRKVIQIDADGEAVRFSDVVEDWQREDFEALDDAWRKVCGQKVEPKFQRAWIERPRGHSKSTDVAVMVCWVLLSSSRNVSGVVAASDKDQAAILRNAISTLLKHNPWLADHVEVQREKILNRVTGSECTILASDVASSYGLLPDFVVCDEICHWTKPELWESLFSSAAKKKSCLLCVITNAGFGESWQWVLREKIRTDPNWYFNALDGPQASWISEEILDEQRRLLPELAFNRLWLNQWSEGAGDALRSEDIRASIKLPGPILKREQGFEYIGGLDLGISRDATAFCVVGKNVGYFRERKLNQIKLSSTERAMRDLGIIEFDRRHPEIEKTFHAGDDSLKVVSVDVWTPQKGERIDLQSVMDRIVELHRIFQFADCACDPWQTEFMVQQLRAKMIPASLTFFGSSEMDLMTKSLLGAFQDRMISLYQHDDLLADLRGLRVKEGMSGRIKMESARRQRKDGESGTVHGDTATALALALFRAKRISSGKNLDASRQLVLYP